MSQVYTVHQGYWGGEIMTLDRLVGLEHNHLTTLGQQLQRDPFVAKPIAYNFTTNITKLAVGRFHTLVLTNGSVYGFGANTNYQLGI